MGLLGQSSLDVEVGILRLRNADLAAEVARLREQLLKEREDAAGERLALLDRLLVLAHAEPLQKQEPLPEQPTDLVAEYLGPEPPRRDARRPRSSAERKAATVAEELRALGVTREEYLTRNLPTFGPSRPTGLPGAQPGASE